MLRTHAGSGCEIQTLQVCIFRGCDGKKAYVEIENGACRVSVFVECVCGEEDEGCACVDNSRGCG